MTLEIRQLSGALGAEITGADLCNLDDDTFAELNGAYLDHQMLCIRDQRLTPDIAPENSRPLERH